MNTPARPVDAGGSLATACPTCSTVFRVVQEQLKVSQGWVRCGRCHEVFNALESLFDLDQRDGLPPARPPAPPRAEAAAAGGPAAAPAAGARAARSGHGPAAGQTNQPGQTGPSGQSSHTGHPGHPGGTASRPGPIHGGWDDGASSAYQPDSHRGALDAAGALRERLAARAQSAARSSKAASDKTTAARSGVFVEETPVDEAELDTRFEPKIFDADAASRAGLAPGMPSGGDPRAEAAAGGAAAAPAAGGRAAPAEVARSADGAAGPAWDETVVDPSALPLEAADPPLAPTSLPAGAAAPAAAAPQAGARGSGAGQGGAGLPAGASGAEVHRSAGDAATHAMQPSAGATRSMDMAGAADTAGLAEATAPEGALQAPSPSDLVRAYSPTLAFDAAHPGAQHPGPVTTPGFLREAERKARWQRPQVRAALTVLAVLLALGALLQVAHVQRDRWAARWPSLRPALAAGCELAGCSLQAPRQIEALVVETSSLTRPPGVDALRLQVVLRNRVDFEVAAPHVELTLNDGGGTVAARRVFNPGEFGITRAVLAAQQDATWSLVFTTPLRSVAGYSVSVFYP